ncbi:MAG TPA: outer membrane beta-barrel protein [Chthoniobacterales bacterium]|jgi:hypothetical protein
MNKTKYITVVFFACLFGCRRISAQALPTATAPGAYISVGTTYSIFESGYGQQKVQGPGVYVDINPIRAVGIEAEGRWLKQSQSPSMSESTYLVGPRVQLRRGSYTPYVKTLVGLNYFGFPYDTARGRYFAIAPGAGVDLMLGNDLKIRLIDVEYQQLPQFTFGTISPYGISFGVSYRVFNGSR